MRTNNEMKVIEKFLLFSGKTREKNYKYSKGMRGGERKRGQERERERESRLDDDLGNEINELTGLRVSS